MRLTVRTRVLDFMQVQLLSDTQDEDFTSSWIKKFKVLVGNAEIARNTDVTCWEAGSSALSDHVGRTRLAKSCGSRDDSLSWNLSRVKQGGAIRADDMDHKTERA